MNLQGERIICATVAQTWAGLNDPEVLKQCIAGCESLEAAGENQFKVCLALKVGPVSARFNGQLRLEDIQPLQSYKLFFEGQGGPAGFGKGQATVTLQAAQHATKLSYNSQANVGGKLAQVGSRLVDSVAAKVADDFFKSFEMQMQMQHGQAAQPALAGAPVLPAQKSWELGEFLTKWQVILPIAALCAVVLYLAYR
jgi:uncharacterized protein